MLFSTSSLGILSSVVAISVTWKRRLARPRSPRPSPPLHLRTAATKQLPARVSKPTVKTHSSRFERPTAVGPGKVVVAPLNKSCGRWNVEQQIGLCGAHKHLSRHHVPRSASPARITCRQRARRWVQPIAAPDLGRHRPAHRHRRGSGGTQ